MTTAAPTTLDGVRTVAVTVTDQDRAVEFYVNTLGFEKRMDATISDVETEHATLQDRGVDVDDVVRWPDIPAMFTFRDVDGNTLYVVETH